MRENFRHSLSQASLDYKRLSPAPHILLYPPSQIFISCFHSSSKRWRQIVCNDTSLIPKQMRMNVLFSFGENCHSQQWKDITKYTSNYITCHRAGSHKINSSSLKGGVSGDYAEEAQVAVFQDEELCRVIRVKYRKPEEGQKLTL